jgi:hypothetical protein
MWKRGMKAVLEVIYMQKLGKCRFHQEDFKGKIPIFPPLPRDKATR